MAENKAVIDRAQLSTLLNDSGPDGPPAFDQIFALVYDELRRLAHRQLANEWGGCTLNTTALVHEAYLKLVDDSQVPARGKAYFFGAAAMAMRRVLVDAARRRNSVKRGGGKCDVTLDERLVAVDGFAVDVIALDDALTRFASNYPRQADVVVCRYFGGLTDDETAAALGISRRSVVRDWALARGWLFRELGMKSSG
jgi:RNA polymerase sigma-70 factor, ECF subfamily